MDHAQRYVCVVDDDPDLRDALRLVLELRGYAVEEAEDGEAALTLLRERPQCCLVLLDLMMPGMNGWEFRKAQRQAPELASIPVLVLSAIRDLPQQADEIEAVACLSKPVDIDHLLEVVGRHCSA